MTRESPMEGGRSASEVVRVEDTVRRSVEARSGFVHDLLRLLEVRGYPHAPRFLGIDEQGREILSYIEGVVPHEDVEWTGDQLNAIARMTRELHDATAGSELAGAQEVVCHNDIAPWNTVVKDTVPVTLIDFDGAAPGSRLDDLAYLLWTFLKLGSEQDVEMVSAKVRATCDTYGLADRTELLDAILKQQHRILKMREALARSAPTESERAFSADAVGRIKSEIEWVRTHRDVLEAELHI